MASQETTASSSEAGKSKVWEGTKSAFRWLKGDTRTDNLFISSIELVFEKGGDKLEAGLKKAGRFAVDKFKQGSASAMNRLIDRYAAKPTSEEDAELSALDAEADAAEAGFASALEGPTAWSAQERKPLEAMSEAELHAEYDQLFQEVSTEGKAESDLYQEALKTGYDKDLPVTEAGSRLNAVVARLNQLKEMKAGPIVELKQEDIIHPVTQDLVLEEMTVEEETKQAEDLKAAKARIVELQTKIDANLAKKAEIEAKPGFLRDASDMLALKGGIEEKNEPLIKELEALKTKHASALGLEKLEETQGPTDTVIELTPEMKKKKAPLPAPKPKAEKVPELSVEQLQGGEQNLLKRIASAEAQVAGAKDEVMRDMAQDELKNANEELAAMRARITKLGGTTTETAPAVEPPAPAPVAEAPMQVPTPVVEAAPPPATAVEQPVAAPAQEAAPEKQPFAMFEDTEPAAEAQTAKVEAAPIAVQAPEAKAPEAAAENDPFAESSMPKIVEALRTRGKKKDGKFPTPASFQDALVSLGYQFPGDMEANALKELHDAYKKAMKPKK